MDLAGMLAAEGKALTMNFANATRSSSATRTSGQFDPELPLAANGLLCCTEETPSACAGFNGGWPDEFRVVTTGTGRTDATGLEECLAGK